MKFARSILLSLAVVALLASCGKTNDAPLAPESPTLDDTAPPAPQGLSVRTDPMVPGGTLTWLDSSAGDVARYEVFEYSPSPDRDNAFVLAHTTDTAVTSWTLPATTTPTDKYFRVRAIDTNGNMGSMSSTIHVALWPGSRKRDPGPGSQPFGD